MNPAQLEEFERIEPGWCFLGKFPHLTKQPKFVSADASGQRIRIRYFQNEADKSCVGKVWFGPECEGPPGHAHGGAVAAVLDEIMGAASWLIHYPALAAHLETNFRKKMPLGQIVWFEARVTGTERKKVFTSARLYLPNLGNLCDATAIFVRIDPERIR